VKLRGRVNRPAGEVQRVQEVRSDDAAAQVQQKASDGSARFDRIKATACVETQHLFNQFVREEHYGKNLKINTYKNQNRHYNKKKIIFKIY